MDYTDPKQKTGGPGPLLLLILGLLLTAAIVFGIKYLVGEDAGVSSAGPAGQKTIFDEKGPGTVPGYNPAARSEITSGNSLELFKEANAGYAGEGSSSAAAAVTAPPEAAKTAAAPAAAKSPAVKSAKRTARKTVIPRMHEVKAFGTAAPARQQTPAGNATMPDISEIMKQAQQQGK